MNEFEIDNLIARNQELIHQLNFAIGTLRLIANSGNADEMARAARNAINVLEEKQ